MKLRNKQTGIVGELHYEPEKEYHFTVATEDPADMAIYRSLTELNSDWEDYVPAEPLIKDEKIRKAVRAWAEAVGEEEAFIVSYNIEYHDCCIYTGNLSNTATIDLGTDFNIKEGSYTIDELCGEEE